jgi:hypothetical protein
MGKGRKQRLQSAAAKKRAGEKEFPSDTGGIRAVAAADKHRGPGAGRRGVTDSVGSGVSGSQAAAGEAGADEQLAEAQSRFAVVVIGGG